jgi:ABC-type nitrate/sulfonate/bicarbonate transport system substrate-binding protein
MTEDQKPNSGVGEFNQNEEQPTGVSSPPPSTIDTTNSPTPTPSSHKTGLFVVLGGIVILLGIATYLLVHHATKKTPVAAKLTEVNVHMGWLNQAQFAGFYVAKEKGFYKAVGLDVRLHEFQDGEDLNQEVSDGKVDFGTSTPLEVIAARDKGNKVRAVAAIYQTSPYCFVSPKSANIQTPADLKGKILGYVGNNTEAQVAYPALMTSYGITTAQATIKDVDFDIVKNFQTHAADTADVYRTDQTYLLDKAGISYNILLPEQFGFGLYGDVVIASDNTIKNHPKIADAFTKATLKGEQYAIDHQDEALVATAKYENALYKDPAYEKYILKNSIPLIKPTGNQPLGNMEFVPWNRAYQAMKTANLLKNSFNVSDVYTTEFIN